MSTAAQKFLVAWFDDEHAVLEACKAARKKGLSVQDVYAPYALHGVDEAMGLAPSRLTWVCFFAGLTGLTFALWLQWYTSARSWPLNIGGKPFASWPAFIPVSFELTVLFAGLGSVAALLARAGLFPGKKRPVLEGVTNDKFALALAQAPGFNEAAAREICAAHGASKIETVAEVQS